MILILVLKTRTHLTEEYAKPYASEPNNNLIENRSPCENGSRLWAIKASMKQPKYA